MTANLPGAARYLAADKTKTCRRCGTPGLAWAESGRTGKPYLCVTVPSESEDAQKALNLVVVHPWEPHRCDEPRKTGRVDADAAFTERSLDYREWEDELRRLNEPMLEMVREGRLDEIEPYLTTVIQPHEAKRPA